MKKFEKQDVIKNVLKTHPKVRFFCYNGKVYYNNTQEEQLSLNKFLEAPAAATEVANSILTESGDSLLTESGDYILIE